MKPIQRTPTTLGVEAAMNTIKRTTNTAANFPEKDRDTELSLEGWTEEGSEF